MAEQAPLNLGNLNGLITAIASYLDVDPNDDTNPVVLAIPGFIRLAEATIGRRLRCPENLARAFATLNYSEEILPSDFAAMKSAIVVSNGKNVTTLKYFRPDEFESMPDGGVFGPYTMYTGKIIMQPRDNTFYTQGNYEIRIIYFQRPQLPTLTSTNACLVYHPDVYLYASLLAAAPFIIDKDRLQDWASLYDSAVTSANNSFDDHHTTLNPGLELGP